MNEDVISMPQFVSGYCAYVCMCNSEHFGVFFGDHSTTPQLAHSTVVSHNCRVPETTSTTTATQMTHLRCTSGCLLKRAVIIEKTITCVSDSK